MHVRKKLFEYFLMIVFSIFAALNYILFVFPNNFAPAGIDGICTMMQYLLKINIGYLSLIVNVPLLIIAFFVVDKDFTIKTTIFTLSFSLAMILLKHTPISSFAYHTDTGTSTVLSPIVAGVLRGLLYFVTLKFNGSSGGIDVIAKIVHKKKPHLNLMNIIFALNIVVATASFFVYDFQIEPVICSAIYMFLTSAVTNAVQQHSKETVKFEIVTCHAQELCEKISKELHQTATIVEAQGAFTHTNKQMVICVTKKNNIPNLEKMIALFPDAVVFESVVSNSTIVF